MIQITLFVLVALAAVCAIPQYDVAPITNELGTSAPEPIQENTVQATNAVRIVKQTFQLGTDKYYFEFETSDDTSREEYGSYRNDTEQQGLVVNGSYRYIDPEGHHVYVSYVSDKNGYRPTFHNDDEQQQPSES